MHESAALAPTTEAPRRAPAILHPAVEAPRPASAAATPPLVDITPPPPETEHQRYERVLREVNSARLKAGLNGLRWGDPTLGPKPPPNNILRIGVGEPTRAEITAALIAEMKQGSG